MLLLFSNEDCIFSNQSKHRSMYGCEKRREISAMSESLKEKPLQCTFSDLNWRQFKIDVTETSAMLDVFSWKLKIKEKSKKPYKNWKY